MVQGRLSAILDVQTDIAFATSCLCRGIAPQSDDYVRKYAEDVCCRLERMTARKGSPVRQLRCPLTAYCQLVLQPCLDLQPRYVHTRALSLQHPCTTLPCIVSTMPCWSLALLQLLGHETQPILHACEQTA